MSLNFKPIPLFPTRQILFILATLIVGIIAFAFTWYISYTLFGEVASAGHTIILALETNSTTSDYVETFFSSIAQFCGVLALIGLAIVWAFQYSQKKGIEVYG